MVQRIGKYDLIFDSQGNMLREHPYSYQKITPIRVPNQIMRLRIQFGDKTHRSHSYGSSSWWTVEDLNSGRTYPMFTSDLHKVINSSMIDHGIVEEREYIGIKKGTKYGIVPYTG